MGRGEGGLGSRRRMDAREGIRLREGPYHHQSPETTLRQEDDIHDNVRGYIPSACALLH